MKKAIVAMKGLCYFPIFQIASQSALYKPSASLSGVNLAGITQKT